MQLTFKLKINHMHKWGGEFYLFENVQTGNSSAPPLFEKGGQGGIFIISMSFFTIKTRLD